MQKQPIFEARTHGYHVYRIPGIAVTPSGVVLATAEARPGKGGDWDENDVVMKRSTDGGASWSEMQVVVKSEGYGLGPVSNFCMIPDPDMGCVHIVFCHNYSRVFYARTEDDGATFAEPREITDSVLPYRESYDWKVIATGPAHGIKSSRGRLIVPLWMSDGSGTEFGAGKLGHRPSDVGGIFSDDGGASWHATESVAKNGDHVPYRHSTATIINPSETIPVELSDGRILFNMRSESAPHRRLVAISDDGATGWSTPEFDDDLFDTVCMASILRLDEKGSVIFAAPDTLEHEMVGGSRVNCDRKQLAVKLSTDDCTTWTRTRIVEAGPAGYSDLALLSDGTILCLYESGQVTGMADDKYCTLARFDREWIENGSPMGAER